MDNQTANWYPVARSDDLPLRHIFHGLLQGRELALWRADDGHVNIWENRCLHRGVRLTIGHNEGRELRCQYHGWRYANRSAGCTYIPAHPADAPARTICNVTFPMVERYGLVWTTESPIGEIPIGEVPIGEVPTSEVPTSEVPISAGPSGTGPTGGVPTIASLTGKATFGLRNVPVNVEPSVVLNALATYRFVADPDASVSVTNRGHGWIELTATLLSVPSTDVASSTTIVFFVQPVDSARSVLRSVLSTSPKSGSELSVLRDHATRLNRFRDELESEAAKRQLPAPMVPHIGQVSLELPALPEPSNDGRVGGLLRVVVARKRPVAEGVVSLELEAVQGQLPTFQPGAHIDVHLPNGLVRQYSLVNGPGELRRYVIGVKREPDSQGGSSCLHDVVREGDVLAISEPRNNFPLRRDAFHTTLIAGGIGATPLLAMAQALYVSSLSFDLHYFAQSAEHLAFAEILEWLGDRVTVHLGLNPDATRDALGSLLGGSGDGQHVYICGPGPMLDAARRLATAAGWPDEAVHFEYFKNATAIDRSTTFEVELARSALTLAVPQGSSIMEVLRANGIGVPSSCEQGACGTCIVPVLAGEPDHQDVYLNDSERTAGNRMAICVSRSRTARLVLDI